MRIQYVSEYSMGLNPLMTVTLRRFCEYYSTS